MQVIFIIVRVACLSSKLPIKICFTWVSHHTKGFLAAFWNIITFTTRIFRGGICATVFADTFWRWSDAKFRKVRKFQVQRKQNATWSDCLCLFLRMGMHYISRSHVTLKSYAKNVSRRQLKNCLANRVKKTEAMVYSDHPPKLAHVLIRLVLLCLAEQHCLGKSKTNVHVLLSFQYIIQCRDYENETWFIESNLLQNFAKLQFSVSPLEQGRRIQFTAFFTNRPSLSWSTKTTVEMI